MAEIRRRCPGYFLRIRAILAQVARAGEMSLAINSGPDDHRFSDPRRRLHHRRSDRQHAALQLVTAKGYHLEPAKKEKSRHQPLRLGNRHRDAAGSQDVTVVDPAKDMVICKGALNPPACRRCRPAHFDATLVSPPLDLTAKKQGLSDS